MFKSEEIVDWLKKDDDYLEREYVCRMEYMLGKYALFKNYFRII